MLGSVGGMVNEEPGRALHTSFSAGSRVAAYYLEEKVGVGGMAVVFRARDERLGRRVALKVLAPELAADEEFRQRFVRESQAAAAVDDPHIIPVYEAGAADGVLFIAMRFVPGGDVASLVDRDGPLPAARAMAVISAVASALDAAHEAGLVHRDVKSANMLLDARPGRPDHVYLSDFGLSKPTAGSGGLTRTGDYLGTLAYSAPEQIGGGTVDGRTDQYALACAVFHILTGAPPFVGNQPGQLVWEHMSAPPPLLSSRLPGLSPAADAVAARALAKMPGDRYRSCREFADALRQALEAGADGSSQTITPPAGDPPAGEAWRPGPAPPAERVVTPVAGTHPATLAAGTVTRRPGRAADEPGPVDRGVAAVAFTPDGTMLAVGDSAGTTHLWHVATGALIASLADPGAQPGTGAVAFSPDGGTLAVGGGFGDVYLWHPTARNPAARLTDPSAVAAEALAFSSDGMTLAVGDDNGIAYLWDFRTQRRYAALATRDSQGVFAVGFSPDGAILAAGDANGSTALWDAKAERQMAVLAFAGSGSVHDVAFSPDGATLATGDIEGGVYLWETATGRWAATLAHPHSAGVLAVAFSPDGTMLAAGDANGSVDLWQAGTNRKINSLPVPYSEGIGAVAFSPDGSVLAAGDANGSAYLWFAGGPAPHQVIILRAPSPGQRP